MYGLNNNTGLTYENSNSLSKINRQNTNSEGQGFKKFSEALSTANEINQALNGLKSNSGKERLKTIAKIAATI